MKKHLFTAEGKQTTLGLSASSDTRANGNPGYQQQQKPRQESLQGITKMNGLPKDSPYLRRFLLSLKCITLTLPEMMGKVCEKIPELWIKQRTSKATSSDANIQPCTSGLQSTSSVVEV